MDTLLRSFRHDERGWGEGHDYALASAEPGSPPTASDLAAIEPALKAGSARTVSMSARGHGHVRSLHTTMMLHEMPEGATPRDADDVLRLSGWFNQQGAAARAAQLDGGRTEVGRSRSVTTQIQLLASMLVDDERVEPETLARVRLRVSGRCRVCVVRTSGPALSREAQHRIVENLLDQVRTPMAWLGPDEFVMLATADGAGSGPPGQPEREQDRMLALVREFAAVSRRRCSVGAAAGCVGALTEALDTARRVSRVSPLEETPRRLYTVDDMFVELGVAQSPQLDKWLRDIASRLGTGPSLLATLDVYYRNDMSRLGTAAELRVHPRTLDYRLRRVLELTGVDPGSTRGVRILTAAVAWALAGH